MVCLIGCSQPDESLRTQGTRIEVTEEFARDIQKNYDSLYDKYVFNDNIKGFANPRGMAFIFEPAFSTYGEIYETETAGYPIVYIPTHFTNGDATIRITFDRENHIYHFEVIEE